MIANAKTDDMIQFTDSDLASKLDETVVNCSADIFQCSSDGQNTPPRAATS